jgi:Cof subfamily protein (haloacid dehalogenase superfamily)
MNGGFPYRLAAIDLDDTLLGPDKQVSAANLDALRALQARGVRIVLASGRRYENMLPFHRKLGLETPIVACQGALVRDVMTGETLHQRCVPAELAEEVIAEGAAHGVAVGYHHAECVYVCKRNALTEGYWRRLRCELRQIEDFAQLAGDMPLKLVWLDEPERTTARFPQVTARFGGRLETYITDPDLTEFVAPNISKAVGVAAVAARYGIARAQVMTFGDGDNDTPMLAWAGLGVAMSDAKPGAKAAAGLVSPPGDPETSFARAVALILERAG